MEGNQKEAKLGLLIITNVNFYIIEYLGLILISSYSYGRVCNHMATGKKEEAGGVVVSFLSDYLAKLRDFI